MDEGPCPKIHTEQLKQAFEDHGDPYMYDSVIEKEFTARLNEADRIIKVTRLLQFQSHDIKFIHFLYSELEPEWRTTKWTKKSTRTSTPISFVFMATCRALFKKQNEPAKMEKLIEYKISF